MIAECEWECLRACVGIECSGNRVVTQLRWGGGQVHRTGGEERRRKRGDGWARWAGPGWAQVVW